MEDSCMENRNFTPEEYDAYLQRKIDIWTAKSILIEAYKNGNFDRAFLISENLKKAGIPINDIYEYI